MEKNENLLPRLKNLLRYAVIILVGVAIFPLLCFLFLVLLIFYFLLKLKPKKEPSYGRFDDSYFY